jgi:NAD(P)H-hydrate epimerase
MRSIDSYCINELKIPGIVLMENAALKVVKNIDLDKYESFCIVCTKGNNGGDGFAIARHLHIFNKKIEVFLVGGKENMKPDCKVNYEILKNLGINVNSVDNVEDINDLRDSIEINEVTIDAIFGTGLSRNVEGIFDSVISIINENSRYIVSVDVPSGLDSNTGKTLGNCIKANKTVSFELYKRGFLNYGTDKFLGKIVIEKIGIPKKAIIKFHNNEFIMDKHMIKENLIKRDKYCHKGDYGKVTIFAGSKRFTGAAYICAEGAVRSGSGLVTLCCPEEIQPIVSSKLVEAITVSFEEENIVEELIEKSDAIAIGPGMGNNKNTFDILKKVINKAKNVVIIDADAINVLKDNLQVLEQKKCKIVLTPHFGEMSRITGMPIEYIKENRLEVSQNFAKENKVIVLLKGYNTIITDGVNTVINPTGNSSMASGGMGDCLTGMITSFIGQGYEVMDSVCIAAFIHGYCGEKLSKEMFCVNASHLLNNIPFAIKELQKID